MKWTIPGTVLKGETEAAEHIRQQMESMFLGGGMVLSQVCSVTGLEPYAVQNWVKRGFLTPPQAKRYTLRQLCRIININMLKGVLSLERICSLLGYVNGQLDDESDDLIDDSQLYFLFVRLAANHRQMNNAEGRENFMKELLDEYAEPVPGSRERVEKVLRIMLTAWAASQMRQATESMLTKLLEDEK
jgi:DNA-binding transcriptional MerR regulator